MSESLLLWKDGFEGEAQGGFFFRSFELKQFMKKVEEQTGRKVVGLDFDGNNVEVIVG